jgi:hypothetical protein
MWERLADHFSETLVERWHEGDNSIGPLHEFMGLTEKQYAAWAEGRWADVLPRPSKGDRMASEPSARGKVVISFPLMVRDLVAEFERWIAEQEGDQLSRRSVLWYVGELRKALDA